MNLGELNRTSRPLRAMLLLPVGLLVAMVISVMTLADGPIASSSFLGAEDPLSENGAWAPVMAYSPYGTLFLKNNGALADRLSPLNHAASRTTAVVPFDHYSEIVVGHIASTTNNVGPIARVQASGAATDSCYLWWASIANGANYLYRLDSNIPDSTTGLPTPPPTSCQLPLSLTVTDFASSCAARSSTDSKMACATSFITPAPTPRNTPPARQE